MRDMTLTFPFFIGLAAIHAIRRDLVESCALLIAVSQRYPKDGTTIDAYCVEILGYEITLLVAFGVGYIRLYVLPYEVCSITHPPFLRSLVSATATCANLLRSPITPNRHSLQYKANEKPVQVS